MPPKPPVRPPLTMTPLPMALVLTSTGVSVLGSALSTVAVPLLVLELTGSAFLLGLVGGCEAAGMVIGNTLGGALADRIGPRRASIAGSALAGVVVALIPLAAMAGLLNVAVLCVLGLVSSACGSIGGISRRGLLLATAGGSADRAEGLYQVVLNAGYVGGVALSGLLVAAVDLPTLLWLDAASFAVTALMVAGVRAGRREPAKTHGGSVLGDWLEGLRSSWRAPDVRITLIAGCVLSGLATATATVALPLYGTAPGSPDGGLAWLLGVDTAGTLLGLGLYTLIVTRVPGWTILAVTLTLEGAGIAAFALAPDFPARLVCIGIAGFAAGPTVPVVMALVRRLTPTAMHGRVLGLFFAATMALTPLFNLAAGAVLEIGPLWTVPAAQAVVALLAAPTLVRRYRRASS